MSVEPAYQYPSGSPPGGPDGEAGGLKAPDPRQLPYLLQLLDDDSPSVRKEIVRYLASFGPGLKNELLKLPASSVLPRGGVLERILFAHEREGLLQKWTVWQDAPSEYERLEAALTALSEFQGGLKYQYQGQGLGYYLNELAAEYLAYARTNDPLELARFLFEIKGLSGAQHDHYNPQNSDLAYVILQKHGLPVSLSCIYMLVGARIGFNIEGYNFPGHFMARVNVGGRNFLVDGYNGGKVIPEEMTAAAGKSRGTGPGPAVAPARAIDIVRRVLNNLINAYQAGGESEHQQLMIELSRAIQPAE